MNRKIGKYCLEVARWLYYAVLENRVSAFYMWPCDLPLHLSQPCISVGVYPMTRAWTQEEIASWKIARDKQRKSQGLPPFDELDANAKKAALEKQRAELFKSTELTLKSKAWPLGRYPSSAYLAPRSGFLELPRHHLSAFGCDRVSWSFLFWTPTC